MGTVSVLKTDIKKCPPLVKGFAVGRTIFGQPSGDWLSGKLTDDELIAEVSERYRRLIKLWKSRQ